MNKTAIFQVLSNLKFDDELHQTGTFFEGNLETFQNLVNDGVLRIIEGATTTEEAKAIVQGQSKKEDESIPAKAVESANTWGPKPDVDPLDVAKTEPLKTEVPTDDTNAGTPSDTAPEKTVEPKTEDKTEEETGDNL